MVLADSIERIRLLVRDNAASVFSDEALVRLWDEVQQEFARETELLERVLNLPVPAIALNTYVHLWEEQYSARPSALVYSFTSLYSYTQPWEPVVVGPQTAPAVVGGYTGTQMWESFYVATQNRLFHYFPVDYIKTTFVAYDDKPVDWIFRTEIEGRNTVFKTHSGLRPLLYVEDNQSGLFYAYPRLTGAYGIVDINSDFGELVYDPSTAADGINPSTNYGVVTFGDSVEVDSNYGIMISAQTSADAFYMLYTHTPVPVTSASQDLEWPRWCIKYIESGVLSKLLKAETDLQNVQLAGFFAQRYQAGLQVVVHVKKQRAAMRTYGFDQLEAGKSRRGRRLADLPSQYSSYWR